MVGAAQIAASLVALWRLLSGFVQLLQRLISPTIMQKPDAALSMSYRLLAGIAQGMEREDALVALPAGSLFHATTA
jgi:hypothetical protein